MARQFVAAAIAAFSLAACSAPPLVNSSRLLNPDYCFVFNPPPYPVIYPPAFSTTPAPDGNFTLVVAVKQGTQLPGPPLLEPYQAQTSQVQGAAWGAAPSPLPSPAATIPPGYNAYGSQIPALAPKTTYGVNFTNVPAPPPQPCGYTGLYQFTTQ